MEMSSQDGTDLLDVIGVMAGHMDGQVPDRDAATLVMDARAFPLFRRDLFQKLQVRVAKQPEKCERLMGHTRAIVSHSRPQILIKSHQLESAVFHHLTIAPGC